MARPARHTPTRGSHRRGLRTGDDDTEAAAAATCARLGIGRASFDASWRAALARARACTQAMAESSAADARLRWRTWARVPPALLHTVVAACGGLACVRRVAVAVSTGAHAATATVWCMDTQPAPWLVFCTDGSCLLHDGRDTLGGADRPPRPSPARVAAVLAVLEQARRAFAPARPRRSPSGSPWTTTEATATAAPATAAAEAAGATPRAAQARQLVRQALVAEHAACAIGAHRVHVRAQRHLVRDEVVQKGAQRARAAPALQVVPAHDRRLGREEGLEV
jgi:hypothetical protein